MNQFSRILFLAMLLIVAPGAKAQKVIEACDRDFRGSNFVLLKTPLGEVAGRVCLDDGDSFSVGPTWLRLRGVDAPEIGKRCLKNFDKLSKRCQRYRAGIEALAQLSSLIEGGATCIASKIDQYNRWLADCTISENRNLAAEMIALGFGCATKEGEHLAPIDKRARSARVGIWSDKWDDTIGDFPSEQCIDH